jgi:hypothetical protein
MKGRDRFAELEEKSDLLESLSTIKRLEQYFVRRGERVYAI